FLYLRPLDSSNPYRLSIVDNIDAERDAYCMLSATGLVFCRGGRTEFVTIEAYEREYRQYHRVRALPFFRLYRPWKAFSEWHRWVRTRRRTKCCAVLQQELFCLNPPLLAGFRELAAMCCDLGARR
ncbi:unnamed protein product, partial [Phaeothamnion confervicola]